MKEVKAHEESDSDSGQASEEEDEDGLKEKKSKSLVNGTSQTERDDQSELWRDPHLSNKLLKLCLVKTFWGLQVSLKKWWMFVLITDFMLSKYHFMEC